MTILKDLSILITAGATREPIDPVRFLSNNSSGKMGFALAEAAYQMGARVTLVSGFNTVEIHNHNIKKISVDTAESMLQMVESCILEQDIFIACAAVCDYKIKNINTKKIKKHGNISLEFVENVDILKTISLKYPDVFTVGFAAETDNVIEYAYGKLLDKKLNMIIANDVSDKTIGFESDYNQVTIITQNRTSVIPKQKKTLLGQLILSYIYTEYMESR